MFGLTVERERPKGYIKEKKFFKHNFHFYIVKYKPVWEFWAVSQHDSEGHMLGTYNPKTEELTRSENFYQLDYLMQGEMGAEKLFRWAITGKKPDRNYY